jgi:alpha-ribazole phosphatase
MSALWVVRHAPVDLPGICYGRSDVGTTIPPEQTAQIIEDQLTAETQLAAIWTSPLGRCRDPASLVSSRRRIPLRVDPRLSEISFGAWELRRYADLEREPDWQGWSRDWLRATPPNGESLPTFLARVDSWRRSLGMEAPEDALIVTHAGVIRALNVLEGRATVEVAWATPIPFLQVERRCR